ncbi:MAG: hypothetical protein OQK69_01590 [Gammaproteobacteria bacterium]|nr:hypothetical protein [Gammaproteobacteria bacterium]
MSAYADGLFDFQMKLAKKGNAEAEFKVGEMYETGFGVKKDQKQAEIWIKKAAAQGHETAGFKLLYWDIKKNGLKGESKKKFAALRAKANDGNPQAMYYLGKMYAYGVGVKKNYDKSLDWLNKATFVGSLEAEREAVVVREMKQKSLAKSRKADEQRKAKEKQQEKLLEEQKQKAEARAKAEAEKKKQVLEKKQALNKEKELEQQKTKQQEADAAKQAELEAKKQQQAEAKAKEEEKRRKQALLKKQAEEMKKKAKETKFESDPCKGKSARFLSTCR